MSEELYVSKFRYGQKVYIDGDKSINAVITIVSFSHNRKFYEVSWWNAGNLNTAWVDEERLTLCH